MALRRLVVLATALFVFAGSGSQAALVGPGVPAWKLLINDAYSGRIDGKYSCTTVRQAIGHLPPAEPLLDPISRILRAYEKRPCSTALGRSSPVTAGDVARGQLIFTNYFCASCHTFRAAGPQAHGQLGPNFDKTKIPFPLVVAVVTNGMPVATSPFPIMLGFGKLLTRQQIQDVAAFISKYSGARKTCAECTAAPQS